MIDGNTYASSLRHLSEVQRPATKEMQDQGFGCCDRREPFICFGARKERDCEHHVPAAADVIAKREAWLSGVKQVMEGRT